MRRAPIAHGGAPQTQHRWRRFLQRKDTHHRATSLRSWPSAPPDRCVAQPRLEARSPPHGRLRYPVAPSATRGWLDDARSSPLCTNLLSTDASAMRAATLAPGAGVLGAPKAGVEEPPAEGKRERKARRVGRSHAMQRRKNVHHDAKRSRVARGDGARTTYQKQTPWRSVARGALDRPRCPRSPRRALAAFAGMFSRSRRVSSPRSRRIWRSLFRRALRRAESGGGRPAGGAEDASGGVGARGAGKERGQSATSAHENYRTVTATSSCVRRECAR